MPKQKKNLLRKNKIGRQRILKLAALVMLIIALPLILNAAGTRQNTKQHAQVVPSGVLPIYGNYATVGDSLKPGWTEQITYGAVGGSHELYNLSPVYCMPHSISWTSFGYEQLNFHAPSSFDISNYTYLTFFVKAGSPGQSLGVLLLGANGLPLPAPAPPYIPIAQHGGPPTTAYWSTYNVPVSVLTGGGTRTIGGIAFKELNGGTQNVQPPPPIFIDEINFSVRKGVDIPACANPLAAQPSIPTDVPTPIMPYYPDISPWVYIIPGIIVALAIIFQ